MRDRVVERNGGFVAKYMGDGMLAYFGYPQAHEHDAEHAVRAALALVEAVPKLATKAGSPLQVRVGIGTGLVVVGDLIGAGAAQEQAMRRRDPNLAARLQEVAAPGTVVIGQTTRRLLAGRSNTTTRRSRERARQPVQGLSGGTAEHDGEPLRGAADLNHAAGRPGRGDRPAAAPLGAGQRWRRASRVDLRRARDRKIAHR